MGNNSGRIEQTLRATFDCAYLAIVNESASHAANMGGDSHFKVTIVSSAFNGQRLIQRHRQVMAALQSVMTDIHALALHTYTPDEWAGTAPASPACQHRRKRP